MAFNSVPLGHLTFPLGAEERRSLVNMRIIHLSVFLYTKLAFGSSSRWFSLSVKSSGHTAVLDSTRSQGMHHGHISPTILLLIFLPLE